MGDCRWRARHKPPDAVSRLIKLEDAQVQVLESLGQRAESDIIHPHRAKRWPASACGIASTWNRCGASSRVFDAPFARGVRNRAVSATFVCVSRSHGLRRRCVRTPGRAGNRSTRLVRISWDHSHCSSCNLLLSGTVRAPGFQIALFNHVITSTWIS